MRHMNTFSLSQLSDGVLKQGLLARVAQERSATAELLAYIAEFDARKLYAPAGYSSMHAYCVGELGLSEDAAFRRIRAARTAREFAAVFPALADGRLNLNAVLMLTPYLKPGTADELLAAAAGKTRPELELLLAHRFPQPDVAASLQAIPVPACQQPLQVVANPACQLAPAPVGTLEGPVIPPARLAPLAPERFELRVTLAQATHDRLRQAQALLGHRIPSGDLAQVLDHALATAIAVYEKRKFAASEAPSTCPRATRSLRHIPAHVRRAVRERDGGQCTFVGESGHRCTERRRLEFDHVRELARGGETSVAGIRLRCSTHNQHTAGRTFGEGFMHEKRQAAKEARAAAKARAAAQAKAAAKARAAEEAAARAQAEEAKRRREAAAQDVIDCLRALGARADEARRAAALCEAIPEAPLGDRIKLALRSFAPPSARRSGPFTSAET
jgi:5-methylcytosine-specific restriction endonuclease McrA